MSDRRRHAPAAARNREPILSVLREVLPAAGTVLEVASGSGEHVVHFAHALPRLRFQPSDPDPDALLSITAWARAEGLGNIDPPLALDAAQDPWPLAAADALLCINMVHIAPWAATLGLMRGAAAILRPGAPLCLYGPYRQAGVPFAAGNEAFDRSLRATDLDWGVRELEAVAAAAHAAGFTGPAVTPMPANNLSLVFRRA